jgi:homogentisate solanesyltransferase
LAATYAAAVALALRMPQAFRVPLMVGAHVLFAAYLFVETARVDAARYSQAAIAAYYRGIWNLFYAQYLLLPFI